jgi:hypothetical protein
MPDDLGERGKRDQERINVNEHGSGNAGRMSLEFPRTISETRCVFTAQR